MLRRSTAFLFLMLTLIGGALFHVKFQVEDMEGRMSKVMRQIAIEEENLHILKAEWTYLNEPQRLQALAEKHLDMHATDIDQYLALDDNGMMQSSSPIQLTSFVRY